MKMKQILFICGRNAGRSQMAQAYFNHRNNNPEVTALSAGDNPAEEIDKNALKALLTDGIDISNNPDYYPKLIDIDAAKKADTVYTMGCNVSCPNIGRKFDGDFNLDDPHGNSYENVLDIYGKLKEKLEPIIKKYNLKRGVSHA